MSGSQHLNLRSRSTLALASLALLLPLAMAVWVHWRGRVAAERLLTHHRLALASALAADLDWSLDSAEGARRLAEATLEAIAS